MCADNHTFGQRLIEPRLWNSVSVVCEAGEAGRLMLCTQGGCPAHARTLVTRDSGDTAGMPRHLSTGELLDRVSQGGGLAAGAGTSAFWVTVVRIHSAT